MKILFVVPYPLKASPSQRFRFEQYFDRLRQIGCKYEVDSFLNSKNWDLFFRKGGFIHKGFALIIGFVRRFSMLRKAAPVDYVFIHREAAPIGPPVIEWILAKVLRKKIIYDFDDAIWLTDKTDESFLERRIRWRNKVKSICKWSYKVSCGNTYLCDFAKQYNKQVILNPTTIDSENLHVPIHSDRTKIAIGWTGSHSTLKYLYSLEPLLQALEENENIELIVIANKKPELNLKSLKYIPWSRNSEAEDLARIDIGVMPLPNDEWTKGKCGFKALQYMAMKIPCVVSDVGVNNSIIDHGVNGFLASSEAEWRAYLTQLIHDTELRRRVGENARKKVISSYSVVSNSSNFLSLFE
jgi:glycosyltransferase involved in cell wall biosynthesis